MTYKNYDSLELQQKVNEIDNKCEKSYVNDEVAKIDTKITNVNSKIDKKVSDINSSLEEKANKNEVKLKGTLISLNECDSDMISAIQGGGSSSFDLLSIPKENSVTIGKMTSEFESLGEYSTTEETPVEVKEGWYNISGTGSFYALSGWNLSYYDVIEGEKYKYKAYTWETNSGDVIFLDSDGVMLSYLHSGTGAEKTHEGEFTVPTGCTKVALFGRLKTPSLIKFKIIDLVDIKEKTRDTYDIVSTTTDYYELTQEYADGYYNKTNGALSTSPSYNMQYMDVTVKEGEKYKVTCVVKDVVTAGVLLTDGTNIKATYCTEFIQHTDVEISIPSGVTHMLLTTRVDIGKHSVKKLSLIPPTEGTGDIDTIYLKMTLNSEREILFKYNNTQDMIVRLCKNGVNLIESISNFYTFENTKKYCSGTFPDFSDRTELKGVFSDLIGPIVASAVNNADGDEETVGKFVGGWHGTVTNNNPSARCVLGKTYIDGREVTSVGTYEGKEVVIEYLNYLQGWNTTKSTADGREILTEKVTLRFTRGKIDVVDVITALEDSKLSTYFGIQTENGGMWDSNILFMTDDRMISKDFTADYDCMERCNTFVCSKNNHYLTAYVKPIGLGNRKYNSSTYKQVHSRNYGSGSYKVYFDLISGDSEAITLNAGESVMWQGGYILSYNNYRLD